MKGKVIKQETTNQPWLQQGASVYTVLYTEAHAHTQSKLSALAMFGIPPSLPLSLSKDGRMQGNESRREGGKGLSSPNSRRPSIPRKERKEKEGEEKEVVSFGRHLTREDEDDDDDDAQPGEEIVLQAKYRTSYPSFLSPSSQDARIVSSFLLSHQPTSLFFWRCCSFFFSETPFVLSMHPTLKKKTKEEGAREVSCCNSNNCIFISPPPPPRFPSSPSARSRDEGREMRLVGSMVRAWKERKKGRGVLQRERGGREGRIRKIFLLNNALKKTSSFSID